MHTHAHANTYSQLQIMRSEIVCTTQSILSQYRVLMQCGHETYRHIIIAITCLCVVVGVGAGMQQYKYAHFILYIYIYM